MTRNMKITIRHRHHHSAKDTRQTHPRRPLGRGLLLAGYLLLAVAGRGQQALFLQQGNITFQKTTNVLAILKENAQGDHMWGARMVEALEKSNSPHSAVLTFNLAFNGNKTLYQPVEDDASKNQLFEFLFSAAGDNTVYTDLGKDSSVSLKNIYSDHFLVTDRLRKIRWKITDETRMIAGFQCRRANAVIMDSVYVVAFYTDMIPTSGGPESFTGLPGMILGLALPHQHMTWFASKVSVSPVVDPAILLPPQAKRKTETITRKALYERLDKKMADWGKNGQTIMQNALL